MTARLSWEMRGNSLILTVTDGPKTSQYTLRKNSGSATVAEVLRGVQKDLGVYRPPPPFGVVPGLPVVSDGPPDAVAHLEAEIRSEVPMTEERSLEDFRTRAYLGARWNAQFVEDENIAARAMDRIPEYKGSGSIPNVGVDDGEIVGTTIDGTPMKVSDYREKPQFNLDNHED